MTEEQSEVTLEEYLHTALKIARQAGNVKNCVIRRSSYNYLASRTWIYDVWGGCVGVGGEASDLCTVRSSIDNYSQKY